MRRTNIYLSDRQLELLRRLGEQRGTSTSMLIRQAVDEWLEEQGIRVIDEDEWERRFAALLARRRKVAERVLPSPQAVEREVLKATREVRRAKSARRR